MKPEIENPADAAALDMGSSADAQFRIGKVLPMRGPGYRRPWRLTVPAMGFGLCAGMAVGSSGIRG